MYGVPNRERVMKDMRAHIEKLRDQAAECAVLSGEAQTKEKREFFATCMTTSLNWQTMQTSP